ncbi:SSI family serine proteinase inhibitor [Actinosynnema sp. NPDC059335]|uniref:SSI family serine proteinase inhibitor n=1 Tax=Actinosynnema sp. NPDC059335 TaxID=3346804 RepID=UPI00366C0C13
MSVSRLLPALAIAAALAAAPASASSAAAAPAATADLTITVHDPLGSAVRQYQLTCDPDGGTHPRPKAACEAIRTTPEAVKPVPPTTNCRDVVYGPERAKVSGLLFGVPVTAEFRRTDSCEEARWQAWLPVWG